MRTDPRLRTGWLGRYLDRAGTPDNPLQGLSLDGELAPSLATGKVPVAALRGADEYTFWAPGVWGEVNDKMLDAIGRLGATRRSRDRALAGAGEVAAQSDRLRRQLAPFKSGGLDQPRPLPEARERLPRAPRRARRDARGRPAAPRRRPERASACTTRTPTSPGSSPRG